MTTDLIRSQADLEQLWRSLMEPLGFTRTSVWMLFIDAEDRPVKQLTEISEAHVPPDGVASRGLEQVLSRVVDETVPGGRVAFLRTRPGKDGLTDLDRQWAAALYTASRRAGVPCEIVHAANDVHLVPVPLDEIAGQVPA
jgi:hypothetical protein